MDWQLIAAVFGGICLTLIGIIYHNLKREIRELKDLLDKRDKDAYDWRHKEYAPMIAKLWGDVIPVKTKVERIEKVLNGALK